MIIMKNALRERIRRKELYLVVGIALLVLGMCGSGAATLEIDGKPITDFDNMFGVMHVISNLTGCALAVVLSLKTIPNEYDRRTSHLVWIRGISQRRYHMELAAANVVGSLIAAGVLYLGIAVYVLSKGRADCLPGMLPGFFVLSINLALVSLFVSLLSIVLPSFAVGFLGILLVLLGVLHGILDVYRSMIGGVSGAIVKAVLWIAPDLNEIQAQAQEVILNGKANVHVILVGLLSVYVITLGFFFLRRREA